MTRPASPPSTAPLSPQHASADDFSRRPDAPQQKKKEKGPQKTMGKTKERTGEKAIWLTYLLFFLIWLVGYWLGLTSDTTMFMGLPLWFSISCLWAFLGVIIALFFVSRRFFS